jgi:hypothetical protein
MPRFAANRAPRLARSLARWHVAVVKNPVEAPEPQSCAHTGQAPPSGRCCDLWEDEA